MTATFGFRSAMFTAWRQMTRPNTSQNRSSDARTEPPRWGIRFIYVCGFCVLNVSFPPQVTAMRDRGLTSVDDATKGLYSPPIYAYGIENRGNTVSNTRMYHVSSFDQVGMTGVAEWLLEDSGFACQGGVASSGGGAVHMTGIATSTQSVMRVTPRMCSFVHIPSPTEDVWYLRPMPCECTLHGIQPPVICRSVSNYAIGVSFAGFRITNSLVNTIPADSCILCSINLGEDVPTRAVAEIRGTE